MGLFTPRTSVVAAFLGGLLLGAFVGIFLAEGWSESSEVGKKMVVQEDSQTDIQSDTLGVAETPASKNVEPTAQILPVRKKSILNLDSEKSLVADSLMTDSLVVLDTLLTGDSIQSPVLVSEDSLLAEGVTQPELEPEEVYLPADTVNYSEEGGTETIVVRKEEFIGGQRLPILNFGPSHQSSAKDSLITKVSGVVENSVNDSMTVEFWRSPINFKGYKMANNKLVIYGLPSQFQSLKLYRLERKIYLRHRGVVYGVDHTFAYKALNPVTDPDLINLFQP